MHRFFRTLFLPTAVTLVALSANTTALAEQTDFQAGVKAYREGNYAQARLTFQQLHQLHPEDSNSTYYLAISEAQLGRYRQAEKLYREILTLNPQSEAAKLAKEGLQYLPGEDTSANALDQPPKFQAQQSTGTLQASQMPQATPHTATTAPQTAQTSATGLPTNVTPQDMMLWQMMMGQMGNGNNNGMNSSMMPWAMMPQADPSNPAGGSNIDPNIMSTMLMNQMMQGFSLDGNTDKDR